jgi:hypothetical protein
MSERLPASRIETVTLQLDGYAVDVLIAGDVPARLRERIINCGTRRELGALWDEMVEYGVGLADPVALQTGMPAGTGTDLLAKTFSSVSAPKSSAPPRASIRTPRVVRPPRRPACRPAAHRPAARRAGGSRSGTDPGDGSEGDPAEPPRRRSQREHVVAPAAKGVAA